MIKKIFFSVILQFIFNTSWTQLAQIKSYPGIYKTINRSYDWSSIENLKKIGQPRKAIEEIKLLQVKAIKDTNLAAYIKAFEEIDGLFYRAKFEETEQEEFYRDYLIKANNLPFPFNNITYLQVGKWINNQFYRGTLRSNDESLLWIVKQDTFTVENNNILPINKAIFNASIDQSEELMKYDVGKWAVKINALQNPSIQSLFEYIAFQLLESPILSSQYEQKIYKEVAFFNKITQFDYPKDDLYLEFYYLLENLMLHNKRLEELSYWTEKRLDYVYRNASGDKINDFDKESLLLNAYKENEAFLSKHSASARFTFLIANRYVQQLEAQYDWKDNTLNLDNNYILALSHIDKSIAQFPGNTFEDKLINLKNHIIAQEVTFSLKSDLIPNQHNLLGINYRNTSSLFLKVLYIDAEDENNEHPLNRYQLKKVFGKQLLFPLEKAHLPHEMDFILPPLKESGSYLFIVAASETELDSLMKVEDIYSQQHFSYKVYNFSNLSALSKMTNNSLELLVTNSVSGKIIPNAKVIFSFREKGKADTIVYSDLHGKVIIPVASSVNYTISKGNDQLKGSAYYYSRTDQKATTFTNFYTDKGIYKPGQTVSFKGILYQNDDEKSVLKHQNTKVELKDYNNQVLAVQSFTTNDLGSFSGNITLPQTGFLLGNINVYLNGEIVNNFRIEEFKLPTFEVKLNEIKGTIKLGDSLKIDGNVKAYAGYPIDKALVTINISQSNFFPRWCDISSSSKSYQETIEVQTDTKGNYSFIFFPATKKYQFGAYFNIEVTVTSSTGEVQSHSKSVYVGEESYQIVSNIPARILSSVKVPFEVKITNSQGVTQYGKSVQFKLEQQNQQNFYPTIIDEAELKDFSPKEFKKIFPNVLYYGTDKNKNNLIQKGDVDTSMSLNLKELIGNTSGNYILTLSVIDPSGEKIFSKHNFNYINLESKKTQHKEGFWVESTNLNPVKGEEVALFLGSSFKKMNVYCEYSFPSGETKSEWINLKKRKKILLTMSDAYSEGVTIRFYSNKLTKHYLETITLSVENKTEKLEVHLKTDRNFLTPGKQEKWSIELSSNESLLQEDASLLVSMYDASLDQFANNNWDTNFKKLYQPNYNWTNVSQRSIPAMYDGWYNNYYLESQMNIRGARSDILMKSSFYKSDSPTLVKEMKVVSSPIAPRVNFAETAFFYPEVLKDTLGKYKFEFTTPDVLTRWNFRAFVHTADLKNGTMEQSFIASKEIMVQPNAPRFLRTGDTFVFAAKVINNSSEDKTITVQLQFKDALGKLDISSDFGKFQAIKLSVKANSSELVEWKGLVPLNKHSLVAYYISAAGENFTDAEQKLIPILSNQVLIRTALPIVKIGKDNKLFSPESLLNSTNIQPLKLTLSLDPSLTWSALMSLSSSPESNKISNDELFNRYFSSVIAQSIIKQYPSFEKTIASWKTESPLSFESEISKNKQLKETILSETPWVIGSQTETEQRAATAQLFDKNLLSNSINTDLNKLKSLQTEEGSWSWFGNENPSLFITQSIFKGLAKLHVLNLPYDEEMAYNAGTYLDNYYQTIYEENQKDKTKQIGGQLFVEWLTARSYFQYVSNVISDKALHYFEEKVKAEWTNYPLKLQALLGQYALFKRDLMWAEQIKASVLDRATTSNSLGIYWNEEEPSSSIYQSQLETQSELIQFLSSFPELENKVNQMKNWLLQQKNSNSWKPGRTSTNVCLGLLVNSNDEDSKSTIKFKDEPDFKELKRGVNDYYVWNETTISSSDKAIEIQSDQPVFGAYYLDYITTFENVTKSNSDLKIERHYYIKEGDKEIEINAFQKVSVGTKVIVKLMLTANRSMEFVHIKDGKSVGMENKQVLSGYQWKDGLNYYLQNNDASTSFFIDYLPKGNHTLSLEMYLTNKGIYNVGPAIIENYYNPSLRSNSNGFGFKVE